eukprot:gene19504-8308_t
MELDGTSRPPAAAAAAAFASALLSGSSAHVADGTAVPAPSSVSDAGVSPASAPNRPTPASTPTEFGDAPSPAGERDGRVPQLHTLPLYGQLRGAQLPADAVRPEVLHHRHLNRRQRWGAAHRDDARRRRRWYEPYHTPNPGSGAPLSGATSIAQQAAPAATPPSRRCPPPRGAHRARGARRDTAPDADAHRQHTDSAPRTDCTKEHAIYIQKKPQGREEFQT